MLAEVADHDSSYLRIPQGMNPQGAIHRILDADLQVLPHHRLTPVAEGSCAPGCEALPIATGFTGFKGISHKYPGYQPLLAVPPGKL